MNQQIEDLMVITGGCALLLLPLAWPRLGAFLEHAGEQVDRQLVLESAPCGFCEGTGYVATVEEGAAGYRYCSRCLGTGQQAPS